MPITEDTPRRLVLKSGSTTLTLDKEASKAIFQRKLLLWDRKPLEAPLADVVQLMVDTAVDRASGVEICKTMVVFQTGAGWAFPADNKADAEANARVMRDFLELRV